MKKQFILKFVLLSAFVISGIQVVLAVDRSVDGEWLGGILYRHGPTCPGHWSAVKVYFWQEEGETKASIDYPKENAFDLPITKINLSRTEIYFEWTNSGGERLSLEGRPQGDLISGDYLKHGEAFGSFQLVHNRTVVKHQSIPDFDVSLLDDNKSISKSDLLGQYYLIDFWFTGCSICIGEMPRLHEMYERFKDKNFTILSLSIDENVAFVHQFRKQKWAMPWLNGHLKESWESALLKKFEFKGSPTIYLVSPEGKILATNDQLLGENLEKTLTQYLN